MKKYFFYLGFLLCWGGGITFIFSFSYHDGYATAQNILQGKHSRPHQGGDAATDFGRILEAADHGDSDAQYNLAMIYNTGDRALHDDAKAFQWFQKAAENGHKKAQYQLAASYVLGRGVARDYAQSATWYRKAAEQGLVEAQYELGMLYGDERSLLKNNAEALKWYRKAAENGHLKAQYTLGQGYSLGIGTKKNHNEAIKWLYKASRQGYALAQYHLARAYLERAQRNINNYAEVSKCLSKAMKWNRESAKNGFPEAQYFLGQIYARGLGVPQNSTEAVTWYRKVVASKDKIDRGDKNFAYRLGKGVPISSAEALEWYQESVGDLRIKALDGLAGVYEMMGRYKTAYMWLYTIKLTSGSTPKKLDKIVRRLSQQRQQDAQQIAHKCVQSHYQDCTVK